MASETDKFVIATFALWAGDIKYCERLLREFSPVAGQRAADAHIGAPEDFIRVAGALRLRQLWQKRGEFKSLAAEYGHAGLVLTDEPLILGTDHLRAAVWRLGEREFLMQAYLTNLEWQHSLFERAVTEASRSSPTRGIASAVRQPETNVEDEAVQSLGVAWAVPGNPFLQVELTDLALLEATALWTEPSLPENGEVITNSLQHLLDALDEPTPTRAK
jgi:hypothetical protein